MRSKIAQRIIDETPEDVKIFTRMYGDIVVRVFQILKEKGISQKELAQRLDKTPSEISKWLSRDHNLTLKSLAKLQAELGEVIIYTPKHDSYHVQIRATVTKIVAPQQPLGKELKFIPAAEKNIQEKVFPLVAAL